MAEGLAKNIFGEKHSIQSAGSYPSHHINPNAIRAMAEIGIDISKQKSKSVNNIDPSTIDLVITLCADEVCPAFLGKAKKLHWPMPDPVGNANSEEELENFRKVRDTIKEKLLQAGF